MRKIILYVLVVMLAVIPASLILGEEPVILNMKYPDCVGFKYNESSFYDVDDNLLTTRTGICLIEYQDKLGQTRYEPIKVDCHPAIDNGNCRVVESYPYISLVDMNCSFDKYLDLIQCENDACKLSSDCPELDYVYQNEVK